IALLLPSRSGVVLATALTLNNLLFEGFIVTTIFWTTHWLLGVTASIRALLLGWLVVEMLAALEIPALKELGARWRSARRRIAPFTAGAAVLLLIALLITLAPLYRDRMIERDPDRAAIDRAASLPGTTALLFDQPALYDRFFAYTRPRPSFVY